MRNNFPILFRLRPPGTRSLDVNVREVLRFKKLPGCKDYTVQPVRLAKVVMEIEKIQSARRSLEHHKENYPNQAVQSPSRDLAIQESSPVISSASRFSVVEAQQADQQSVPRKIGPPGRSPTVSSDDSAFQEGTDEGLESDPEEVTGNDMAPVLRSSVSAGPQTQKRPAREMTKDDNQRRMAPSSNPVGEPPAKKRRGRPPKSVPKSDAPLQEKQPPKPVPSTSVRGRPTTNEPSQANQPPKPRSSTASSSSQPSDPVRPHSSSSDHDREEASTSSAASEYYEPIRGRRSAASTPIPVPLSSPEQQASKKKKSSTDDSSNPLVCPICNEKQVNSYRFKNHMEAHEGLRPFPCPICKMAYTSDMEVLEHVSRRHSDETHFVCPHCGIGYKTRRGLDAHKCRFTYTAV